MQDCGNSTADALELLESCTKPSISLYAKNEKYKAKSSENLVTAGVLDINLIHNLPCLKASAARIGYLGYRDKNII